MKCKNCDFSEAIVGTGLTKCTLTGEARLLNDNCNCDDYRVLKEGEIEIVKDKKDVLDNLTNLRNKLISGFNKAEAQHVIDLLEDETKDSETKITEAINYLNQFV